MENYIYTWLVGYSALLGPIVGILIVDYFILRKTKFDLNGLYRYRGPYTYWRGFNLVAIGAFFLAVLPNLPGFFHAAGLLEALGVVEASVAEVLVAGEPAAEGSPAFSLLSIFDTIYLYAWFVGFFLAGGLYLVGMMVIPHNSIPSETQPEAAK